MPQRLGEILLARGSITAAQLQAALARQHALGRPLGDALVNLHICTSEQVLAALAVQAGLPPIDLDKEKLDRAHTRILTREMAEWYRAVPLWLREGVLGIAIGAPASPDLLEDLRSRTEPAGVKLLSPFLASDQAISRAIFQLYGEPLTPSPTILLHGPAGGHRRGA